MIFENLRSVVVAGAGKHHVRALSPLYLKSQGTRQLREVHLPVYEDMIDRYDPQRCFFLVVFPFLSFFCSFRFVYEDMIHSIHSAVFI